MIDAIRNLFRRRPRYINGRIFRQEDGYALENVRLNTRTGRVEFVLWRAGQQGHTEDYWHEMGCGWELHFIAQEPRPNGK